MGLLAFGAIGSEAAAGWKTETAARTGEVRGDFSSLAVDGDGKVHIAYYDRAAQSLCHAENGSGAWSVSTIDGEGDRGHFLSLARDSGDAFHVAYYDADAGDLRYARQSPEGWVLETVDAEGDVGRYPSLDLTSDGLPRIAYYDATNRRLRYAAGSLQADGTMLWILY